MWAQSQTPSLESLPDILTVEEAAKVLRIGRNTAYDLARRWIATKGAQGLPVVKFGRTLRVPRAALLRLVTLDDGATTAPDQSPRVSA